MEMIPFKIHVEDAALVDLRQRLSYVRWPDDTQGESWVDGMPIGVLRRVVDYWRDQFDWRAAECEINKFPQFKIKVRGLQVHFLHVKGADDNSPPLILSHGWPGSFAEMLRIIPLLTDPENNGLPGFRSFDVVVPSLPGFAFSEAPSSTGTNSRVVASILHELMTSLGYRRYFAQGGDIGSGVSMWMAKQYPDSVRALHLNFVSSSYQPPLGASERPMSAAESAWKASREEWMRCEGGYSHIQATKPQTLAYSLTDSPVGLAAWILEKFFAWSDGDGDLLDRFDIDELLINISLYWFSGNVASSLRIYKENAAQPLLFSSGERIGSPLCFASFPKEIINPPREWLERVFNIVRWSVMHQGGHFAALEQPNALARDIHESFAVFRQN